VGCGFRAKKDDVVAEVNAMQQFVIQETRARGIHTCVSVPAASDQRYIFICRIYPTDSQAVWGLPDGELGTPVIVVRYVSGSAQSDKHVQVTLATFPTDLCNQWFFIKAAEETPPIVERKPDWTREKLPITKAGGCCCVIM
jgi:hypothetical protein